MKIRFMTAAVAVLATSFSLFAQSQGGAAAAAAGPKPKSQKEADALMKVQAAQNDPDGEIAAIDNVLENFKDTEFKVQLLNMATDAAQRKGDYEKTVVYGERTLQADPNNIMTRVTLAETIASHTRENDLDKETSLKKVDDYSGQAITQLKGNPPAPPGMPAEKWPELQKELMAEAQEAQGQALALRKKYPEAISTYKTALSGTSTPNPTIMARLAKVYTAAKQYDDTISTADKVMSMATAQPAVKQYAQQQKDIATKMKSGGGAAAPPAAPGAPATSSAPAAPPK